MIHIFHLGLLSIALLTSGIQNELSHEDELMGKFDPATHSDFVLIESPRTSKSGIYLRKQAYEKAKEMMDAAALDGINLTIISATRNFNYQKGIWERKWSLPKYQGWTDKDKAAEILKYSSMPGTSRHHWGTDVDFNSVEPSYFAQGNGKKIYDWLVKNGPSYGYHQTYTSKELGRTGYNEEKWHWSYLPLAKEYLKEYNKCITYDHFINFKGASVAKEVDVIELYVNGIDNNLK
ncbi:MAG: M15 family metallopeptidase [Flavobacteriales bacterium]|nr:M15 family metallopeptidase [Flavobacteriales bacterium]